MGQQQLLLTVLGVIILGIAVIVAVNVFTAPTNNEKQYVTQEVQETQELPITSTTPYKIIEIEDCEYLVFRGGDIIIHKGNCNNSIHMLQR